MAEKKSFLVYKDKMETVDLLEDAQAGQLFKALMHYANSGALPAIEDKLVLVVFSLMKQQMDHDTEKYAETCKRRSENVKKRWQKQAHTNAYTCMQNGTKITDTDTVTDTDTDTVTDTDTDTDTDTVTVTDTDTETDTVTECSSNGSSCCYPEHYTQEQIRETISALGYHWSEQELADFIEYNTMHGWKYSLATAARKWENQRQRYHRNTKPAAPEQTPEEIEMMNEYLSLVNRFKEDDE